VVSPQSDVPSGWDIEMLYKLLQQVKQRYRVNENKVYLTGLSMGGFGTWSLAMKHPEEFAAIAPVCGGGDTTEAWKLRHIPVWCFHGAKDDVVPPAGSENLVNATRVNNPSVRFTLYPGLNHNSWDATYNNDSLYNWLLSQTRFAYKEIPTDNALLKKYAGTYLGSDKDTVLIIATETGLAAKPGRETIPLKKAGEDLFFIKPNDYMELRFAGDGNNITGFQLFGKRRSTYRRI
jgi:hypothetical protein